MIIRELLLEASHPWTAPSKKLELLDAILTPEALATHRDAILHLLGSRLALADIHELKKHLGGDEVLTQDEVAEVITLLRKVVERAGGKLHAQGHPTMVSAHAPDETLLYVDYRKGRWNISHGVFTPHSSEKFEDDDAVMVRLHELMRIANDKLKFFNELKKVLPPERDPTLAHGTLNIKQIAPGAMGAPTIFQLSLLKNGKYRLFDRRGASSSSPLAPNKVADYIKDNIK